MEKLVWIISLIGSLGAVAAAIAAWQSAKETKKTVIVQIILELIEEYSSEQMLSCMLSLRNWKEKYGSNFAEEFTKERESNYSKIKQIDNCRRIYVHRFHRIKQLLELGVINRSLVKKVISLGQITFLLDVVEPLEKVINPNYDASTFETFRSMYKDKL